MNFNDTDIHFPGPECWRHLAERRAVLKEQAEADKAHALPAMDDNDCDDDCSSQPSALAWHISDLTLAVGLVGFIAYVVLAA
jgi:hypothetical protein